MKQTSCLTDFYSNPSSSTMAVITKDTNSLNILEILSWDLLYFNTLKSEIYSINTYSYTLNCKNPDISEL